MDALGDGSGLADGLTLGDGDGLALGVFNGTERDGDGLTDGRGTGDRDRIGEALRGALRVFGARIVGAGLRGALPCAEARSVAADWLTPVCGDGAKEAVAPSSRAK